MPATQRKCIYGGLTLDVDRHYIGSITVTTQGKRHNNTWVEPLAGNCTTSSTREREQVWHKCKIQKNWCIVTVAPTIEHHGWHSRTPANQRWDQVPGRSQRPEVCVMLKSFKINLTCMRYILIKIVLHHSVLFHCILNFKYLWNLDKWSDQAQILRECFLNPLLWFL